MDGWIACMDGKRERVGYSSEEKRNTVVEERVPAFVERFSGVFISINHS